MSVDISIVAYNSRSVIDRCLSAAMAVPGAESVVVVDHGDDSTARRAEAMGARGLAPGVNQGFGAGQNRGVAEGRAPFVLMLNPDADIVPEAVRAGAELLARRPEVAAVQGVIVNRFDGGPERSQGRELGPVHLMGRALGLRRFLGAPAVRAVARRVPVVADHLQREPAGAADVQSLAATAILVRRSAFEAVGGFDETYFLYGEDLDLCHRLRKAGWTLVAVPQVWATHTSGGSAESSPARELAWWQGTMTFAARWWSRPAWAVAVVAATLRWARLALVDPGRSGTAFASMVAIPWRRRLEHR